MTTPFDLYDDLFPGFLIRFRLGILVRGGVQRLRQGGACAAVLIDPHDPAAGEPSLGLKKDGALRLQDLEGLRPELQAEDVSFMCEQVVPDVEPRHRLQVGAHDALADERADLRGLVAAPLEIVERGRAKREPALVVVVPRGDTRIEVPAVVIEARGVGDASDVVDRSALDLAEPDDDVGDLDAGVVDVVLHLDRCAPKTEHPDERVSERRITQVANVRRLVRIDGRVFDDGFLHRGFNRRYVASRPRQQKLAPIEVQVQIPGRRRVHTADARNCSQGVGDNLRDCLRCFPQRAGQLKGHGNRQIAHGPAGWHLDSEGRDLGQAERPAYRVRDGVVRVALNAENHGWSACLRRN